MKNILVVDSAAGELLSVVFKMHNNQVIQTSSGETAIRVMRRWKPDLLVVGYIADMPMIDFIDQTLPHFTQRPMVVGLLRSGGSDAWLRYAKNTMLENGFDIVVQTPILLGTLLAWADKAELGKQMPPREVA